MTKPSDLAARVCPVTNPSPAECFRLLQKLGYARDSDIDELKGRIAELLTRGVPLMTKLSDLAARVYLLMTPSPAESSCWTLERIVQRKGPDLWAIRYGGDCLNRECRREYEPMPSSRDDEFLARCRFATPEEALAVWDKYQEERSQ